MAFDSIKQLMLEKQYLYVRASKGFALEGVSTEQIWSNVGYYRFLVDNVQKALGNSYVRIHHMASDTEFMAECSDLFLEEIQNSVVVAVETLTGVIEDFAEQNHTDITTFSSNVGNGLNVLNRCMIGGRTAGDSVNLMTALTGNLQPSATNNLYQVIANLQNTVLNRSVLEVASCLGPDVIPSATLNLLEAIVGNNTPSGSVNMYTPLATISNRSTQTMDLVASILGFVRSRFKHDPVDFSVYDSLYSPSLVQSGDYYKCDCTSLLESLSVGEPKSFLIERSALQFSDNTHVKMLFSYGVPVGSFSIMTSEGVNKVFEFNTSFRDDVIFFDHPVSDFGSSPQTLFIKIVLTKLS